jgi:hypothetical protein
MDDQAGVVEGRRVELQDWGIVKLTSWPLVV